MKHEDAVATAIAATSPATRSRSPTTAGTTSRPRRSRSPSGRPTPTRPGPARAAVGGGGIRARAVGAPSLRLAIRRAMTRVKICGLTTLEDAHQAVELGAWALGMIFWPRSPRACPIEQAEAIGAQLQPPRRADGRVRERAAGRGGRHRRRVPAHDAPAPRRRGPRLLPARPRGAPGARSSRPRACATPRRSRR